MKSLSIDLLGEERRSPALGLAVDAGQLDFPLVAIIAGGLVATVGLPPLATWAVDTILVNPATALSDGLTRQISQNKGAGRKLNELQAEVSSQEKDLQELQGLVGQGGRWASALEELRNLTPTDLWLTSFKAESDRIVLAGMALNYKEVAYFYTNLQSARNFTGPVLQSVSLDSGGPRPLVQFSLHASLVSTGGVQ